MTADRAAESAARPTLPVMPAVAALAFLGHLGGRQGHRFQVWRQADADPGPGQDPGLIVSCHCCSRMEWFTDGTPPAVLAAAATRLPLMAME